MTTMDAYIQLNIWTGGKVLKVLDTVVDACRWLWRARMRRKDRRAGAHRNNDRSTSVWEIFNRMTDEELQKSSFNPARVPGAHRDSRGWRYAPATWKQIPLWESERGAAQRQKEEELSWRETVDQLMSDIRYMLDNPPEIETYHGCKDCLCGLVPA